jgi:hypothetical protein
VLDLVKAQYDEHLAEDLVLQHADGSDGSRYQEILMKHRLERAKLEVQLYASAIAKQSQYSPSNSGLGLILSHLPAKQDNSH